MLADHAGDGPTKRSDRGEPPNERPTTTVVAPASDFLGGAWLAPRLLRCRAQQRLACALSKAFDRDRHRDKTNCYLYFFPAIRRINIHNDPILLLPSIDTHSDWDWLDG